MNVHEHIVAMDRFQFHGMMIQSHMMRPLAEYIVNGNPVGDFLQSVIASNLKAAVVYADDRNIRNIPAYVAYLYNKAPAACHGNRMAYENWIGQSNEK